MRAPVILPLLVGLPEAKSSIRPSAMPSGTPESMYGKSANTGIWNSTPGLTSLPGVGPPLVSATESVRCSGTNCSSASTSLLPVPRSPPANQLSMTLYCERCRRNTRGSGGALSSSQARPASMFHSLTRSSTTDRKSTRLNSSHSQISYAVFCLKKKQLRRHRDRLLHLRPFRGTRSLSTPLRFKRLHLALPSVDRRPVYCCHRHLFQVICTQRD